MRSLRPTQRGVRHISFIAASASLLAISAAMTGTASATSAASSSWAQTDGTAGHARANLNETILSPKTVLNARLQQKFTTPTPTDNCDTGIPRSPVLADGTVYDISSGWISAYDASTGAVLWQHDLDAESDDYSNDIALTSLTVANGLVIAGGDWCDSVSDPNSRLFAYDATTGDQVWQSSGSFGALDSFVVSGDEVVSEGQSVGSGTVITGFNLETGAADWTQTGDSSCGGTPTALVVHNVVVTPLCAIDNNGDSTPELVGLDLSTGDQLWSQPGTWTVSAGSDHGVHGHIYAQPDGGVLTDLNASTGAVRLTLPNATKLLAVDNTKLYAACGTNEICGYSEATGAQLWEVSDVSTLAAEANGVLYLSDGKALRTSTGTKLVRLWRKAATSLSVGDGTIAVVKPLSSKLRLFGLPS